MHNDFRSEIIPLSDFSATFRNQPKVYSDLVTSRTEWIAESNSSDKTRLGPEGRVQRIEEADARITDAKADLGARPIPVHAFLSVPQLDAFD